MGRERGARGEEARRREPGGPAVKHRALPQRDRATGPNGEETRNGTREGRTGVGASVERGEGARGGASGYCLMRRGLSSMLMP